jgi:hypothetical protein
MSGLRLYRYRLRPQPINGWYCDTDWVWRKPGLVMGFSDCLLSELPGQVDDIDAALPIFRALRDHGVELDDFYEYQGEPRTFNVWPPETNGKPVAKKLEDVVSLLLLGRRTEDDGGV